jgi:hypothetical protein
MAVHHPIESGFEISLDAGSVAHVHHFLWFRQYLAVSDQSVHHLSVVCNLYSAPLRVPITDLSVLFTLVSRPHPPVVSKKQNSSSPPSGGFEKTVASRPHTP